MTQLEIKGALAKLLATENLIVQHDARANTASFNTATRVLTLPILQIDNGNVYDMFIGHEVGHALYTPADWRDRIDESVPFDYVNVIEDVRIERLIQNKFPGLRTDFSQGYRHLNDQDFFEIHEKDISKLSFIDRINLHFKLGALAVIPFNREEMTYVRAVDEADTFEKVCLVSKMLAEYMKAKREQEASQTPEDIEDGKESPDAKDESSDQQQKQSKQGDQEGDDKKDEADGSSCGPEGGEESETQRALDKNLQKSMEMGDTDVIYVETPTEELDIYPLEFLRDEFREAIAECRVDLSRVREEFNSFLSSIKKDVGFMVQQFEMRKSADAYARQQIHKTGVLDTERLHQFKISDDIFLRQSITPDGKNHGLVMLVDWSGSMSDHIIPTVKQLLVLVQFCRKIGIPFDVYTFTCSGYGIRPGFTEELKVNEVSMAFNANVTHILSSSAKRREIDEDMFHLFNQAKRIAYTFAPCVWVGTLSMGGTPLNNVLFAVPKLIEDFKKRTGTQKVSFVCLTDGESSPLHYNAQFSYGVRVSMTNPYGKTFLRDGRNTYQLDPRNETPSIIHWLTKKMPDVSITNIFLSGPKGFVSYYRSLTGKALLDTEDYKKNGAQSFSMDRGWPLVCVVNPNSFKDAQDEIQVEAGESKAKIKTALKKFLKSKSVSKLILTQLVEQFA